MARTDRQTTARPSRPPVTPEQLREAERGLRLILARNHSAAWIAQNVREVLAEASRDYVLFVREHGPARNPPGWLIERGRLRASNLTERENRRSGPSLDSVIHTAEDSGPTPEEAALEDDRRRRIEEALSEIPERQRRLIALVYWEGLSISAAGRLLGWGKSRAAEHHAQAMERLKRLIGPQDQIAEGLLGLLALAALDLDRRSRLRELKGRVSAVAQDFGDLVARPFGTVTRNAAEASRRVAPFTEGGNAAFAGSGAGRVIAQCGAVAAICGAIVASSPPVEHLIRPPHPEERLPGGSGRSASPQGSTPPTTTAPADEPSRSSAVARTEEARRIDRRRIDRARRRARAARVRRARKVARRRRAEAIREKRAENIEARPEEAPEASEPVPEAEAVAPNVESSPPPATGAQTREEFGL